MKKFSYTCGCCFDILDESKKSIQFDPFIENINLECSRTWDLISEGNTKGIFQLESRLGRSIAKKLKPENIEQLSALISIMRPGCLEAIRGGKSVTNHYIDKKNGEESLDYFHPSLEPILKTTYGEMIYQEQAMEIAKNIAGFNLQEADMLRKAIGKKKPEEMAKIKTKFLDGVANTKIVNQSEAEQIFGWIEKSQRYSFNKSHSVSYAVNAYLSAYAKAHFPKIFFASYLRFAKDKIDPHEEIKALVQNANEMDVSIKTPDLRIMNEFFVLKNNDIYFGLTDIKGVGSSVFVKLNKIVEALNQPLSEMSWPKISFMILSNINSTAAKALIESGATSFIKKTRTCMLFEQELVSLLTKKESSYIIDNIDKYPTVKEALEDLLLNSKINKNRKKVISDAINMIQNPPYSLEDSPEWIADVEDTNLGCAITCSKVDMYDISMTNATCRDFKNGINNNNLIMGGEIDYINITKTKNGQNPGEEMSFVTMSDGTGSVDSIIFFPDIYKKYKSILFSGNVIIVCGSRSRSKDSFVVEKAYVAKT
jgi:DNA polymerase-3 subunit alpha